MRMAAIVISVWVWAMAPVALGGQAGGPVLEVYKTPTCGCCVKWMDHMRQHGFDVKPTDVSDLREIKARSKVPPGLFSCHTALVGGYVIEGHVPALAIRRLLSQRPTILGLGVAGMPTGSPGMEGPNPVAYDVLSFDAAGKVEVFASYRP